MKLVGELNKKLIDKPYIHRIELLDRFYKLLDNNELVFVNPDKWEDPLENLIFNSRLIKNGKPFQNPAKERIFSQCWSYEGDSYGIWKIYTTKADDNGEVKRHMGVRITTKLDKLITISKNNPGEFYYGLMDYKWKHEIDKLPKDPRIIDSVKDTIPNVKHIETLLFKRKSYAYENEVRLFSIPDSSLIDSVDKKLCRLKINPLELITSIRFDPGMDYNEFKTHKLKLENDYGFRPSQITQSTYFKKNKYIIRID
ncbi:hypothetical protein [Fontibacter flavus]|uniref:DUF2971 domain-containing protein n=1 Tax=Fontibacter flavus TaxID=654838 RepID=A0ABV6FVB2_9BACT